MLHVSFAEYCLFIGFFCKRDLASNCHLHTQVVESLSSETGVFPLELFEWDLITASEQGVLVKFRLITSSERDAMRCVCVCVGSACGGGDRSMKRARGGGGGMVCVDMCVRTHAESVCVHVQLYMCACWWVYVWVHGMHMHPSSCDSKSFVSIS